MDLSQHGTTSGLYRGYIGIMGYIEFYRENGLYRGYIGDNGKENGIYYLGFRVQGLSHGNGH